MTELDTLHGMRKSWRNTSKVFQLIYQPRITN